MLLTIFNSIESWDFSILNWIQKTFASPFFDKASPIISYLGDGGIFLIALALLFLCFPKTRRLGLSLGMALIFGVIIGNVVLKNLFFRIRPYDVPGYEAMREALLVPPLSDGSFPSGHTLAVFEGTTVFFLWKKRYGLIALFFAILVAFSRLYLFVHYPSDVIAGALLGILFGIAGFCLVKYLYEKFALDEKLLLPHEKKQKQ